MGKSTEEFTRSTAKWETADSMDRMTMTASPIRYDTIVEFNVDSKAEYSA